MKIVYIRFNSPYLLKINRFFQKLFIKKLDKQITKI